MLLKQMFQQQQQDLRGTIQFWRDLKIWKLIGGKLFVMLEITVGNYI